MYGSNKVAQALEDFLRPSRIPWTAIAFGLLAAWFLSYLLPWAARGFPVVGQ